MATPIDPGSFTATQFDYLIAGGGTAGLTVAARLTEDPNIVVGVIEAGYAQFGFILPYFPNLNPTLSR